MSTLADRREHKFPAAGRFSGPRPRSSWRDFVAALIFAVVGIVVSALALAECIPLVGDGIWNG